MIGNSFDTSSLDFNEQCWVTVCKSHKISAFNVSFRETNKSYVAVFACVGRMLPDWGSSVGRGIVNSDALNVL